MVGLEARREFDIGEFRERARVVLPVLAGVGGMVGAVGLYLAVNAGRSSAHGWAVAMSTDTAFALGDPARSSAGRSRTVCVHSSGPSLDFSDEQRCRRPQRQSPKDHGLVGDPVQLHDVSRWQGRGSAPAEGDRGRRAMDRLVRCRLTGTGDASAEK